MTEFTAPIAQPAPISLTEAVRLCLSRYVQFSGRASRPEYWKFILALIIAHIALIVINSAIFGPSVQTGPNGATSLIYNSGWLGSVFTLATLLPLLAAGWRRLHDTDLSGWWLLAPIAAQIVMFFGTAMILVGVGEVLMALRDLRGFRFTVTGSGAIWAFVVFFAPWLLLIVALARRGTPGPNRFGPDPLGGRT